MCSGDSFESGTFPNAGITLTRTMSLKRWWLDGRIVDSMVTSHRFRYSLMVTVVGSMYASGMPLRKIREWTTTKQPEQDVPTESLAT